MTDSQFSWYMVVNWLVAVGTIGAVLVALFGKVMRAGFLRPTIKISLLRPDGELCPITDGAGRQVATGRYFHLKVRNTRTWARATHAQLRLIRVETPRPDGQFQIAWDGDIPVRRRHQEHYATEMEIGNSAIDFDLCAVVDTPPTLLLMPIIAVNNLPMRWTANAHLIASFQLKCSETESEIARIQVDWDGMYHNDAGEMSKHLVVQQLTAS